MASEPKNLGDEFREAINTEVALGLILAVDQLGQALRKFRGLDSLDDHGGIRDPSGIHAAESRIRGEMLPFGGSCEIEDVIYSVPDRPSWTETDPLLD